MKILLVNIDSVIPNLALHKLSFYHKERGDEVSIIKDTSSSLPLCVKENDKVFVSCVFTWNKYKCKKWEGIADIGGSGYSLTINLPPEIEKLRPKINYGFTTRGCIRNCYFCIVHKKEGGIRVEGDIYDIWDGKSKEIIIMDNNLLALPEHFFKIANQIKKEKLRVDFNQGLDFRLLTDDICKELVSLHYTKTNGLRFSFDDISYKPKVLNALDMLKKNGMKDWSTKWYVYVGVKDTVDNVLERINILRDNKCFVYVMRDKNILYKAKFNPLVWWSSYEGLYKKTPYYEGVEKVSKEFNLNLRRRKLNIFKGKKDESE